MMKIVRGPRYAVKTIWWITTHNLFALEIMLANPSDHCVSLCCHTNFSVTLAGFQRLHANSKNSRSMMIIIIIIINAENQIGRIWKAADLGIWGPSGWFPTSYDASHAIKSPAHHAKLIALPRTTRLSSIGWLKEDDRYRFLEGWESIRTGWKCVWRLGYVSDSWWKPILSRTARWSRENI